MRTLKLIAPLATVAALVACQPVDQAGDYAAVLPDDRVAVNLPAPDASMRAQGELSELYALTANTTDDVNGMIAGVLVAVNALMQSSTRTSSLIGSSPLISCPPNATQSLARVASSQWPHSCTHSMRRRWNGPIIAPKDTEMAT